MRQIFNSTRLETVEGVARLLNDAGIETYVNDGRSYKGGRRRAFSYRAGESGPVSGVWIINAEDQTRARELLREAGLIDSTRTESSRQQPPNHAPSDPKRVVSRVRIVILSALMVAVTITVVRGCATLREQKKPETSHIILIDTSNP